MAQRQTLQAVRKVLVAALPGAEEVIAWGMPSLRIDGDLVVSYQGFSKHNSLFPSSSAVFAELSNELGAYTVTKGSIHFDLDRPLPATLIRKIVRVRLAEINESYPRKSGETKCFYSNGFLKYRGRMKNDAMHGRWEWFRKDGSIMRTGEFRAGQQRGKWRTFAADGSLVSEKSLD
jgi:uncharacterized protein YdhG (YjbR/CyaY superfamily)